MLIAERLINVNGVELCTESFGDPADPPIVLVVECATPSCQLDP